MIDFSALGLPAGLRSEAVPLTDSAAVAWPLRAALQILQQIEGGSIAVLGGDVLVREPGTLQYTYDNWHSDIGATEDFHDYALRSVAETREYLRRYPDREGTHLYVLVLADELPPDAVT